MTSINRLNSVKNTNFGLYNKKLFLTDSKIVFGVTDHFCIKWTFRKNALFCPKNAFFWKKWQFNPLDRPGPRRCQRTFFSIGLFLLKFWRIFSGKVRNMVKPLFEHFQFYQKWAIFERFEKKSVQNWLEPYIKGIYYPNALLYTVFDNIFAKKCPNFSKNL